MMQESNQLIFFTLSTYYSSFPSHSRPHVSSCASSFFPFSLSLFSSFPFLFSVLSF